MTAATKTATLIESGPDGFVDSNNPPWMIVETAQHGRLYLKQCAMPTKSGGAFEGWGAAWSLQPGDTHESLRAEMHNAETMVLTAMLRGFRDDRPALSLSSDEVHRIAEAAQA